MNKNCWSYSDCFLDVNLLQNENFIYEWKCKIIYLHNDKSGLMFGLGTLKNN